jgi:hypothetical protein
MKTCKSFRSHLERKQMNIYDSENFSGKNSKEK